MSKDTTTISLKIDTKEELDTFVNFYASIIARFASKPVTRINYDDVIRFLLKHVKIPESPLIKQ